MPKDIVRNASAAMQATKLENDLKHATEDKETVAKAAQVLRNQIAAKDQQITLLTQTNERIAREAEANTATITDLQKQLAAVQPEADKPKPIASRNEVGKYAATIFGSILQASRMPATVINSTTAADAVRGAKMLCGVLDREFPTENPNA